MKRGTWLRVLQAALIVLAGWYAVSPALRGDWLWDDHEIRENPDLHSLSGLARAWVSPAANDYYPVESTVLAAGWRLWGDNPAGYHAANLVLHLLSSFLIWRILRRLGVGPAWAGGLLFAAHPLAVESVAWVSEIKNTLSLFLLLLSADFWIQSADSEAALRSPGGRDPGGARRSYGASLLLFIAAMLAKASVVMFPFVILLLAWWKRGRVGVAALRAAAPFFAASLALGLVTVHFQAARAIRDWRTPQEGVLERLSHAGLALGFYAWKSVFPSGMMAIYPRWPPGAAAYAGLLAWVVLAVLVLVLARGAERGRAALLGLGWFVLNLAPVLGFIPMSFQHLAPVADHFAYLSLVAVAGLAAAGLGLIRSRLAPGLVAVGVAAILAAESHAYARTFASQEALWTANAARNPGSAAVRGNLGFVLHAAGKLDRSVESYQRAAQLDPDDGQIEDELAGVLAEANRGPEANAHLEKAIAAYKRELRSYPGLHDVHGRLGIALAAVGRGAEAVVELEKALSLDPGSFKAQNNLANVLINLPGRLPEAVTHLEAAATINPGSVMVQVNLGYALLADGRPAEAVGHYREALRLEPDNTDAHNNLGYALAQLGRFAEARAEFEAVLRLKPGDADARANLARLPRGEGP